MLAHFKLKPTYTAKLALVMILASMMPLSANA
jgi:hypothetical protein